MNNWNLRQSILIAAHRWHIILAVMILGALLGALTAFIWPSPFKASSEIIVGLNPYRALEDRYVAAFAQTEFRNVDDYKYWQMQQLDGLAFSDEYLRETLSRLEQTKAGWQDVNVEEFSRMLSLFWRNAGEWRLVAESPDPDHAQQAVQAWKAVILEKTDVAIAHSQNLFELELQLRAIADSHLETQVRLDELEEATYALAQWKNDLSHHANSDTLTVVEHWRLWSIAAQAAGNSEHWRILLNEIPPLSSPAQEYLLWIGKLDRAVVAEAQTLNSRLMFLDREHSLTFSQWQQAVQRGQGLAATLQVEPATDSIPEVGVVRPLPLMVLVGSGLGFIFYVVYILVAISRSSER